MLPHPNNNASLLGRARHHSPMPRSGCLSLLTSGGFGSRDVIRARSAATGGMSSLRWTITWPATGTDTGRPDMVFRVRPSAERRVEPSAIPFLGRIDGSATLRPYSYFVSQHAIPQTITALSPIPRQWGGPRDRAAVVGLEPTPNT